MSKFKYPSTGRSNQPLGAANGSSKLDDDDEQSLTPTESEAGMPVTKESESQQPNTTTQGGQTVGVTVTDTAEKSNVISNVSDKTTEAPIQPIKENKVDNSKVPHLVNQVNMELGNYLEVMQVGKSVTPEIGATWQYSLFTTFKTVLNASSQEEFNASWNSLLAFFFDNSKEVFNENFIYRFPEHWVGSGSEFTIFRRLVHVALSTCNTKQRRKALADLDLEKATEGLTEDQKNKLLTFYS